MRSGDGIRASSARAGSWYCPSGYARRELSDGVTETTAARLYERYEAIFDAVTPPFAFVDLDAMGRNAKAMLAQAGGLPIRIASKSVRSLEVLRRILALETGFAGILAFTLPEALWLRSQGFEDIVVAYPTVDRPAIAELSRFATSERGHAPVLMVDAVAQLDLIEATIGRGPARIPVAIDVDAGWWLARGRLARVGPKRSPLHWPAQARRLAEEIVARPGTELAGLMAYEGQIAGVGDRIPGRPFRSATIRWMQSRSERDLARRLPEVVGAVREVGPLGFVNGGGTGSLARTAPRGRLTELTAGSGFYAPALFDNYARSPSRRRPSSPAGGSPARPGGGRPAPAAASSHPAPVAATGCPSPTSRPGCVLDGEEGAGEVQTPLIGSIPAASALRAASTSATPRPASSASTSTRSISSPATRSSTRSRPTAATGRRFCSDLTGATARRPAVCTRWRRPGRDRAGRGWPESRRAVDAQQPATPRPGSGACPSAGGRRTSA